MKTTVDGKNLLVNLYFYNLDMLHFQNMKQFNDFHMYQSEEEQTEEVLLSIGSGRNSSCCSLTQLSHFSPQLALNVINPITDMIRKPITSGRRTVRFWLDLQLSQQRRVELQQVKLTLVWTALALHHTPEGDRDALINGLFSIDCVVQMSTELYVQDQTEVNKPT